MKDLKKILDFVDSYCLCLTDGKHGFDDANKAQLKADITKLCQDYCGGVIERNKEKELPQLRRIVKNLNWIKRTLTKNRRKG